MRSDLLRRARRPLAVLSFALLLSACVPGVTLPGGGGPATCPEGTYSVTSQAISGTLTTPYGSLSVVPQSGGALALTIGPSTWTLAGSQGFDVSATTPWGPVSGSASVSLTAAGTWTKTSSTELSFTLGSASGSGTFTGTVLGNPVTYTASLSSLGLHRIYGLSGTANYACSSDPSLTLDFTSLHLNLKKR